MDDLASPPLESRAKKRVLFLRQPTGLGGAELGLVNWLRGIDYEKNHVMLGYNNDVFSARLGALGLPVECIPFTLSVKGSSWTVFYTWLKFLRRLRPDIIVLGDGWFLEWPLATVLAAYFASWGSVYMSEHLAHPPAPAKTSRVHFGFLPGFGLWRYWAILPWRMRAHFSKQVLAVSEGLKEWLVQSYGYPPKKIAVVYRGVDTERFCRADTCKRASLRASMELPSEATVIVSTARLSAEKCLDRLIKAFDVLAKERPDIWLVLAGEGRQGAALRELAASLTSSPRIKFLGHQEDVSPALKASDIFVLPSDYEALGTALLEAMAAELVCVATRTVGPPDIIEDNVTGFLVPISYEGVLEGLKHALALGKSATGLIGSLARQTIERRFRIKEAVVRSLECFGIEGTNQFE